MVNGKALMLGAVLLLVWLAGGGVAAQEATLGGEARRLVVCPGERWAVAAMALEGAAFVRLEERAPAEVRVVPEWPTLDGVALDEGRALLAGRDRVLRLVSIAVSPEGGAPVVELLAAWPTEVLPVAIERTADRVYIAGGAAGLHVLEWDGEAGTTPRLRARYPFVEFAREVAVGRDGRVVLADKLEQALHFLDISDIQRPRALGYVALSYVDGLAVAGSRVVVAERRQGVLVYGMEDPSPARLETRVSGRGASGTAVSVEADGAIVAAFGDGRVVLLNEQADGRLAQSAEMRLDRGVRDAVLFDDSAFLALLEGGRVRLVQWPE